jgi:hypothetical protein
MRGSAELRRRAGRVLQRLEAHERGRNEGGVFVRLPDESEAAALARAEAAGRRGHVLLMPQPLPADEWQAACRAYMEQQARDTRRRLDEL